MMDSVCNYGEMSARLHVTASAIERRITVEVRAYGMGEAVCKVFPADQYGEALDLYAGFCEEMKRRASLT